MAIGGLLATGIGAGLGALGGVLGSSSARRARAQMLEAANMPGLDTSSISREALAGQLDTLDEAEQLAGRVSASDQARLLAQEEAALPGAGAARTQALQKIVELLGDDDQWLEGVRRRGAALGLSRGLGGSPAAQLGTLRLSDTESMQRRQLGTSLLGSLLGTLRIANTPSVQTFMAPSASQLINIRAQERQQRQNILANRAEMPTSSSVWGGLLGQVGGVVAGAGVTNLLNRNLLNPTGGLNQIGVRNP